MPYAADAPLPKIITGALDMHSCAIACAKSNGVLAKVTPLGKLPDKKHWNFSVSAGGECQPIFAYTVSPPCHTEQVFDHRAR
jgi:hypothetical protein